MHCYIRPPNITPVVLCFNYEADNAPACKFNILQPLLNYNEPEYRISTLHEQYAAQIHSDNRSALISVLGLIYTTRAENAMSAVLHDIDLDSATWISYK